MNHVISATQTGAIVIDRKPYAKSRLRVFPYTLNNTPWAQILINDDQGTVVIPATPYNNIINEQTAAPFASPNALEEYVRKNFFIQYGNGDGYQLQRPQNLYLLQNGGTTTISFDAVEFAEGYVMEASRTPHFATVLSRAYSETPEISLIDLPPYALYYRVNAVTTRPGNYDSGYSYLRGYRVLANDSYGVAALDAAAWAMPDTGSVSNGAAVSSVVNGVLTMTGGVGTWDTFTNGQEWNDRYTALANLTYPRTLLGQWKMSQTVTIGSVNQANVTTMEGGGVAAGCFTFALPQYHTRAFICTSNLQGCFGRLVYASELNATRVTKNAFTTLNVGDKVRVEMWSRNHCFFATAYKLDGNGHVTESLDVIQVDQSQPYAAYNVGTGFYGGRPCCLHVAGTHSYSDFRFETDIPASADFHRIGDSHTAWFANDYRLTPQNRLRALYPDKIISEQWGVGYMVYNYAADAFLKAETWALQPKVLYINLGYNDLGAGGKSSAQVVTAYRQIISEALGNIAGVRIYIALIPPSDPSSATMNGKIVACNAALTAMAGDGSPDMSHVTLIDVNTPFLDPRGNYGAQRRYFGFDHDHYTEAYFEIEVDQIVASGAMN